MAHLCDRKSHATIAIDTRLNSRNLALPLPTLTAEPGTQDHLGVCRDRCLKQGQLKQCQLRIADGQMHFHPIRRVDLRQNGAGRNKLSQIY